MLRLLLAILTLLAIWWASAGCAAWCPTDDQASASLASDTHATVAGARADEDEAGDDEGDDDGDEADDEEQAIALDQVPADVLAAARAAVPGVLLTSAELEKEHGQFVYCLSGTVEGEAIEIEVAADGRVLEIERGED